MSTSILPFAVWQPGTNQNSIPANDNSLRNQILNGLVISDSTDAQPGSPADGDIYIMTGSASGTQWGTFDQYDLAIFDSGTWYAYAPVAGIIVNISGSAYQWDGSAYTAVTTGGGGGGTPEKDTVIEEAVAFTATPSMHAGRSKYTRAGGDVTFDSNEGYAAGEIYKIRATGSLTLIGTGVTLTPPYAGTLDMEAGMSVQVTMTSATAGDVIGETVVTP